MQYFDVIIVGAGPTGLFAALNIDSSKNVLVLEKMQRPGKKLLLSGNGQCNLTHSGDIKDFLNCYGGNGKFLKHSLFSFTNIDLMKYFKNKELEFFEDKRGKIFPRSLKAKDVLNIMLKYIEKLENTELYFENRVEKVEVENANFIVYTNVHKYCCKSLLISTGGKSYPNTGSCGEGQDIASMLGHKIIYMQPCLTPVFVKDFFLSDCSGNSFENAVISIFRNNKKIHSFQGELLITHKGVSGPLILDNSRYMEEGDVLKINFYNIDENELREYFYSNFQNSNLYPKNFLKKWKFSEKLKEKLLDFSEIPGNEKIRSCSKKKINRFIQNITSFRIPVDRLGDYNIAMATKGGISLKEINPKTMESKLVKNLFFAGEVMDIDGNTGGYNLQAAFSTAYTSAKNLSL